MMDKPYDYWEIARQRHEALRRRPDADRGRPDARSAESVERFGRRRAACVKCEFFVDDGQLGMSGKCELLMKEFPDGQRRPCTGIWQRLAYQGDPHPDPRCLWRDLGL